MFVSIVVVDLLAVLQYIHTPPQNGTELHQHRHQIGQTMRQYAQNIAKADPALQVQPLPTQLQIILESIYATQTLLKSIKKKKDGNSQTIRQQNLIIYVSYNDPLRL